MKLNRLNILMLVGMVAIAGILIIQLFLLKQAVDQEETKFDQKARLALLEVAKRLYQDNKLDLPDLNPVKEVSEDHYVVNINKEFTASALEFYMKSELARFDIITDFEYAIYNCETDGMVYGNYVSFSNKETPSTIKSFPKQSNLVYYFAIRFPKKASNVYASLWLWIVFSVVMFFVLLIYIYSAFKLLQQKKYSELQRDFINNMTHEFKTPLSSILLASNYMTNQPVIVSDPKLKKYSGIIIEQAGKLNDHVGNVLDLARAESSLFKIRKESVDIDTVIMSVVENVTMKHSNADITYRPSHSSAKIHADKFHFENVMYNLIDNSIKYSGEDPRIVITLDENDQNMILCVKDEGIGIAKKHLENIFDKFYRAPGKMQNEVAGFGLGLFYVKKICDAHKWKISVVSEPEKGTTIKILMPKQNG